MSEWFITAEGAVTADCQIVVAFLLIAAIVAVAVVQSMREREESYPRTVTRKARRNAGRGRSN